jgi:CheY-like chemotaxis protein
MQPLTSVLVIDDNGIDNFISRKVLESFGIPKIVQFERAVLAVDYLRTTSELPQLILLDIRMPEMDGFQFLKKISEMQLALGVGIVMLSTSVDPKDREMARMSHCNGYVEKPLTREKLSEQVEVLGLALGYVAGAGG